ncbi:MAG: MBL fold metallo-hydrolase [Acidobacteriota bacterium]|nr:MBL fold metallo-hydrolase [Acidobacteriota bacterium]
MNPPRTAAVLYFAAAASVAAFAQTNSAPAATGSGIDISGTWRYGGHQDFAYDTAAGALVDYGGFPLNEAGRLYALAWPASRMTVRQQQCAGYGIPYAYFSPGNYRFWEERDPHTQQLIAIHMWFQTSETRRTIWMDGRPHPPAYAAHTFPGFSTGEWKGSFLTITTTHLKRAWLRGNGLPSSDEATVIERLIRHGDRLTVFTTTTDPVYFDAPYTKTVINIRNIKDPDAWLYPCEDGQEIVSRPEEQIPYFPWGKHPFLREFADSNGIPLLAVLGGAQTMHPGFDLKLKDKAAADAAAVAETVPSHGPQQSSRAANPEPNDGDIHVLPVQGSVYMLAGDGGNIAVQIGDEGAFLVDAGAGKISDKVVGAIRKLSRNPIQFIVNSSFHPDHTGGNANLASKGLDPSLLGSFFVTQAPTGATGFFADPAHHATLIGHNNILIRMEEAKLPSETIPPDTYLEKRRRKYHNGELVEIFHAPNAITDGDSIVHFRKSDVIATGDIYDTTRYPFIDVKNGGTIHGEIDALNNILEKTGYEHDEDGGTMIIPGHGRLSDEYDVAEYRDMVSIICDRVQTMMKTGATLDQVKAARLTADYDTRYGATSGPWTTDMFVEAVYNTLTQKEGAK